MYKYTRKGISQADLLERILTRTTLTTQRIGHTNILEIGGKLLDCKSEDVKEDHEKEIEKAVEEAEARATRELKAALKRQKMEMEQARRIALDKQKQYHSRYTERVFAQRDRAEIENIREVKDQLEREKEEALEEQRASMLKERANIIKQTIEDIRREVLEEMKDVMKVDREEAARMARELAEEKAAGEIERMRCECVTRMRKEIGRLQKLHNEEILKLNRTLAELDSRCQHVIKEREAVETEYELLQEDYKRFLDYTDGRFHSDYLMKPKSYGRGIADATAKIQDRVKTRGINFTHNPSGFFINELESLS